MSPVDEIQFGVLISAHRHSGQTDADVLARSVAVAQQAEACLLDDVWVTEHHFAPSVVSPSALAFAAFLLGRTNWIRVGTGVTLLPLHSPLYVAEQAALLDHLSGGRLMLGVGRGQPLVEYEIMGPGVEQWRTGLPEALDAMLAAWQGEVTVPPHEPVTTVPGPLTTGGPPLYVATGSPNSVAVAAARALPMLMYFDKDAGTKAQMVAAHREAAEAHGHPDRRYDHAFAVYAQLTETPEQARDLLRTRARNVADGNVQARRLTGDGSRPDDRTPAGTAPDRPKRTLDVVVDQITDDLLASNPVGDAQICVERLVHGIEVSGCRRVLCQVELAGDIDAVLTNIQRLAEEVLPEVRRMVAAGVAAPC